jgi:MarR family transcriptional regulator, organic hydroperoxide resistance regulator
MGGFMNTIGNQRARQRSVKSRRRGKDVVTKTLGFLRSLWAVDHGLRSLSKQMQATIGLTGPQRLVLRMLGRLPPVMPSELADLLHLDRSTVSGVLERLVEQNLLVRRPHPEDGRSVLVALSARGKLLDRETPGTVEACVQRALSTLPRRDLDAAIRVLDAVARELASEGRHSAEP